MNQQVMTTYSHYETRQTRPATSPFALAKTYAAKFADTYDPQFAFAAIKHAANLILSKPCVALSNGTVEVTVNTATATTFARLRERVAALLPGVTFAEVDADHTVGVNVFTGSLFTPKAGDRATLTTQRRKLKVSLPEKALSDTALSGVLDYILTHVHPREVRRVLSFFGYTEASFLDAIATKERGVNSVIGSLFDALIVDDGAGRPLKEDYSEQMQSQFVFAVNTRHDGGWYRIVAEMFGHHFEE